MARAGKLDTKSAIHFHKVEADKFGMETDRSSRSRQDFYENIGFEPCVKRSQGEGEYNDDCNWLHLRERGHRPI